MGKILTLKEAAELIRCSRTHLQNATNGRVANVPTLPCIRVGRRVLIRLEALEVWLRAVETPRAKAC